MLLYGDVTAWIRHLPSTEGAMPKPAISAKQTDTARVEGFLSSGASHPDRATAVLIDFIDTIFTEGAHNWSPAERDKRIDDCLAKASAYRKAEDKQDIEALSRKLRNQIETSEFDVSLLNKTISPRPAETPHRPLNIRQAIKELAESIEFD